MPQDKYPRLNAEEREKARKYLENLHSYGEECNYSEKWRALLLWKDMEDELIASSRNIRNLIEDTKALTLTCEAWADLSQHTVVKKDPTVSEERARLHLTKMLTQSAPARSRAKHHLYVEGIVNKEVRRTLDEIQEL